MACLAVSVTALTATLFPPPVAWAGAGDPFIRITSEVTAVTAGVPFDLTFEFQGLGAVDVWFSDQATAETMPVIPPGEGDPVRVVDNQPVTESPHTLTFVFENPTDTAKLWIAEHDDLSVITSTGIFRIIPVAPRITVEPITQATADVPVLIQWSSPDVIAFDVYVGTDVMDTTGPGDPGTELIASNLSVTSQEHTFTAPTGRARVWVTDHTDPSVVVPTAIFPVQGITVTPITEDQLVGQIPIHWTMVEVSSVDLWVTAAATPGMAPRDDGTTLAHAGAEISPQFVTFDAPTPAARVWVTAHQDIIPRDDTGDFHVVQPPPQITVDPIPQAVVGQPIQLSWQAQGVDRVDIWKSGLATETMAPHVPCTPAPGIECPVLLEIGRPVTGSPFEWTFNVPSDRAKMWVTKLNEPALADDTGFFRVVPDLGVTFTDVAQTAGDLARLPPRVFSAAMADFNGDDRLDLAVVGGATEGLHLFLQRPVGPLGFDPPVVLDQRTTHQGIAAGDLDLDHDLDIVVAGGGAEDNPNRLFVNNGRGSFTDVAEEPDGIADTMGGYAVALADFDRDTDPDIVVTELGAPTRLWRNLRDGRFAGALLDAATDGRSAAFGDFDDDGFLDLYVASPLGGVLLKNLGNRRFENVTGPAGVGEPGTAAAWGDFNGDGRLDLFTAHLDRNHLYKNLGSGRFEDVVAAARLAGSGTVAAAADYDNDGDLDLCVAGTERVTVYQNIGNDRLQRYPVFSNGTFAGPGASAVAWGDVNGDSFPDLYVGRLNQGNALYLNSGTTNRWVQLDLSPNTGADGAIGARVTVTSDAGTAVREVVAGARSMDSPVLIVGLGSIPLEQPVTIRSLDVRWPHGTWDSTATQLTDLMIPGGSQGLALPPIPQAPQRFMRGDVFIEPTATFPRINITDGIVVLNWLFLGGVDLRCEDAADANDDGRINITDAVRIFGFLFLGTPSTLPAPWPELGLDATPDDAAPGAMPPVQLNCSG